MNRWSPFSQCTPAETAAAQKRDYAVLIPNPYYINKRGFVNTAPRYRCCLAYWTGDRFVDEQMQPLNVEYFFVLPEHV